MNLLFIFSDQQHRDALGCMNNPNLITPNIDRLAAGGVLFRRCYSSNPVCGPFRGCLFTGQYTSHSGVTGNGAPLPQGTTTFADALNAAGYQTSYVGKWHLGGNGNCPIPIELRGGFQRFKGYQCYNGFYDDVCFYDENDVEHRYDKHREEAATDLAVHELETMAAKNQPFALMVSYQAPHYPVQPAPEFEAMYRDRELVRRPNCTDINPHTPTVSPRSPRPVELDPNFQRYGNNLDEYLRLYNAMCTQVDDCVGRLLATVERLGKTDDTLVIYTSDHGDMQGSHGLKNKNDPHEESAGIPLVVRVPGVAGGRITDALVSGIDFMPTCLEILGAPPVAGVDGKSFAPLLRGEADRAGDELFVENGNWRMIVTDRWKLAAEIRDGDLVPVLMTDPSADPYELNNRAADSALADIRSDLLSRLRAWCAQWNQSPFQAPPP